MSRSVHLLFPGLLLAACKPDDDAVGPLPGDPADPAIEAFADVTAEPAGWEDVQDDVVLTRIPVRFREDATIGEVNAALGAVDGSIARSIEDVATVIVDVPGIPDLEAHLEAVAALEQSEGVWFAEPGLMGSSQWLPSNVTASDPVIDHLVATRAPAAWNARLAFGEMPGIGLADKFGAGIPASTLHDGLFVQSDYGTGVSPGDEYLHGYSVLSVIDAIHGGTTEAAKATGVVGETVHVRAFDDFKPQPASHGLLDWLASDTHVLNVSQAHLCVSGPGAAPAPCSEDLMKRRAAAFAKDVRARGREEDALLVVAAGNLSGGVLADARRNNRISAAAKYADLVDAGGNAVPPLSNVIVVEGITGQCPWYDSASGGDLAAPSADVFTTSQDDDDTRLFGENAGTSFAAPQVAGAAALVWSLLDAPSATTVRNALLDSASPGVTGTAAQPCRAGTSAPVLDTYAAVLAVDDADLKVREAILDVDDDGVFDAADIVALKAAFGAGGQPWSRFDLNGDGSTGGDGAARFDLDADGTIDADETAVRDVDVLCRVAWSEAYSGDPRDRASELNAVCDPCISGVGYRTDHGNGGTFDSTNNIVQSFALARLGNATSGDAVLRLFDLCPDHTYDISIRGQMDEANGAPGNTLSMTIGSATLSITQVDPPPTDQDLYGNGEVTADANGEILATITAANGNGVETDHAWIIEINATAR